MEKDKKEVPLQLIEPPLFDHLFLYTRGFDTLSTERSPCDGGVYPIPWSSIMAYADRYLEGEMQKERFYRYVSCLDLEYCNFHNKQLKQKMKASKKPKAARRGMRP